MSYFNLSDASDALALLDHAHTDVLAAHAIAERCGDERLTAVLRAVAGVICGETEPMFAAWWATAVGETGGGAAR